MWSSFIKNSNHYPFYLSPIQLSYKCLTLNRKAILKVNWKASRPKTSRPITSKNAWQKLTGLTRHGPRHQRHHQHHHLQLLTFNRQKQHVRQPIVKGGIYWPFCLRLSWLAKTTPDQTQTICRPPHPPHPPYLHHLGSSQPNQRWGCSLMHGGS